MKRRASLLQREIKQTRPFASPAQEALLAILRTAEVLRRRLDATLGPAGVTVQQYNVLRILRGAKGKPLPTLEIGSCLVEQTPGITRLLDRLETKGLVRRVRCTEDRREVHCFITPAGLKLLDRLDAPVLATDEAALEGLAARELGRLIGLLERIRGPV